MKTASWKQIKAMLYCIGKAVSNGLNGVRELDERVKTLEVSGGATPEQIKTAVDNYMDENPIQFDETDPTLPDWAKQPNKPSYTADEVGAQPKGDYALRSEIPAMPDPYTLPVASADTLGGVKVGEGLEVDADGTARVKPENNYERLAEITLQENVMFYAWAQDVGYKKLLIKIECPLVNGYVSATNNASYIALGDTITRETIVARIGELAHSTYTTYIAASLECKNGRLFCDVDASRNLQYNNSIAYTSSFLNNGMVACESIKRITIGNLSDTLYAGLKIIIEGVRADG